MPARYVGPRALAPLASDPHTPHAALTLSLSLTHPHHPPHTHTDRSIPIPYLPFKQALQREVSSNNAPQQQQQQFADVFHLLEVLSHARYSSDARYLQSAMALVQPQLSETDRHLLAPTHGDNDTAAAEEQQLLSSIIRLLLEARYTPLTDEVRVGVLSGERQGGFNVYVTKHLC